MPSPRIAACNADSVTPRSGITKEREKNSTMIGMPRITLIRLALSSDRTRMPETRIIAQTRPSTVESSSEPIVTTIVSTTPLIRIGKNSAASCQKPFIDQLSSIGRWRSTLCLQTPFIKDLVDGAIGLQLGERGIDLAEQRGFALAHADADRADGDGLVAVDQVHLGEAALLQIVGEDRIVRVTGLEAAGVHVAQDVGDGVVGLDVGEQAGLLQRVDEGGADLGADRLALQIVLRGVGLRITLRHHEAFAIGVDRVGE